jgi:hypothetical protein
MLLQITEGEASAQFLTLNKNEQPQTKWSVTKRAIQEKGGRLLFFK